MLQYRILTEPHCSPHSLDTWDPRKEAYESKDFNSYTTGPGRNIPRDVLNR